MTRARASIAAALLTFVVSGCGGAVCPAVRWEDPTSALASYASSRAPARSVRAEASVDRRDGEGRVRGDVMMFVERPDRVRFDAMTQLGPAAILTSDGSAFALTDLRENKFYSGPTCPENVERLLGLPMAADDVALLLFGEAPRIAAEREVVECRGGSYVVTLHGAGGLVQTLELAVVQDDVGAPPQSQRMLLTRTEVRTGAGELDWRVTWSDHRAVRDTNGTTVSMPFRVRFEQPARGVDTLVRFDSIDLNVTAPEGAFTQSPRPGLTVEAVECAGP